MIAEQADWRRQEAAHTVYGWLPRTARSPGLVTRAERVFLWTDDGRRLLDFASGQVSVNIGYGHPKVLAAMRAQLERLTYVSPNFATMERLELARLVAERAPAGLDRVFFGNSGSEAIEDALKLAKAVTGRSGILSSGRSYHGATTAASAISGDPRRLYVQPAMPGLARFDYPDFEGDEPGEPEIARLRANLEQAGPATLAAVVVEPIGGTTGLYVPPPAYLREIRRFCDAAGCLLIADETMSGWGRTGKWFACEHYDLVPDILTTAKGITSSYVPLGAMVTRADLLEPFIERPFIAGHTTEAHALACATGIAMIRAYEEEGLIGHSATLGHYLMQRLRALRQRHPIIRAVRGRGLFGCVELWPERVPPARIVQSCLAHGLIVIARPDFFLIAPPLVITREELDEGLDAVDRVLEEVG